MRHTIFIILLFSILSSCHHLINDLDNDTLEDGIYEDLCTPFVQQRIGFSVLNGSWMYNKCIPSTQKWDTIWASVECFADWTLQNKSINIVSFDTSSTWVVFYAKNDKTYNYFFNIVGDEGDSICRITIEQMLKDVYLHMTEGTYILTDACGDSDSIALKQVIFNNGIAHTQLKFIWLLYPNGIEPRQSDPADD